MFELSSSWQSGTNNPVRAIATALCSFLQTTKCGCGSSQVFNAGGLLKLISSVLTAPGNSPLTAAKNPDSAVALAQPCNMISNNTLVQPDSVWRNRARNRLTGRLRLFGCGHLAAPMLGSLSYQRCHIVRTFFSFDANLAALLDSWCRFDIIFACLTMNMS